MISRLQGLTFHVGEQMKRKEIPKSAVTKIHKQPSLLQGLAAAASERERLHPPPQPATTTWSSTDKHSYIQLSHNSLRATGLGSVRATHPIPPSTMAYFFEIRIVSGSATIGLTSAGSDLGR